MPGEFRLDQLYADHIVRPERLRELKLRTITNHNKVQLRRQTADWVIVKREFASSPWAIITAGMIATLIAVALVRFVLAPDDLSMAATIASTGLAVSLLAACPAVFSVKHSKQVEEGALRSEERTRTDQLTKLPNRDGLLSFLEQAIEEASTEGTAVGVLYLDLNRFKVINDSLGHETGDELLREVGKRIEEVVRSSDVVARIGGDEFVVVTRGMLNASSSVSIAEQILAGFTVPIQLPQGGAHVVTPSIGIATTDVSDVRGPKELLRDADSAMFRAKRAKTGYAIFDEEHRRDALVKLDVERALRVALDDNQLDVFYQPIVNSADGTMAACEALVRWNRPGLGMVGPDTFIPVAEEAGLVAPLGEMVMVEACAQASLWRHNLMAGCEIKVGVNVAELQLIDPDFVKKVAQALELTNLPPHLLTIEITENIAIDHLGSSLSVLRDVKNLGVSLAIDDFGTGLSSLSYIRQLDMVDALKIDRVFVKNLGDDPVDLAIVQSIIALANAVELEIIAEGVETQSQYEQLRDLGVTRMQGYLFARPVCATELETAIENGSAPPLPKPTVAAPPRRNGDSVDALRILSRGEAPEPATALQRSSSGPSSPPTKTAVTESVPIQIAPPSSSTATKPPSKSAFTNAAATNGVRSPLSADATVTRVAPTRASSGGSDENSTLMSALARTNNPADTERREHATPEPFADLEGTDDASDELDDATGRPI